MEAELAVLFMLLDKVEREHVLYIHKPISIQIHTTQYGTIAHVLVVE